MNKNTIPKVSIIVPIHNAGVRLTACLDTLINQTLNEIEIILVLDCPTDNSDIIAKKYAANDNRIVILENSTNQHIGISRNNGLNIAKGEYIGFSDHDDYRELTMYEELYQIGKSTNSDIVLGISTSVGDQNYEEKFAINTSNTNLREFALTDLIRGGDDISLTPKATNIHPNLYKKELLTKNNIKFVDTLICIPEDRIFQIMCLYFAESVILYPKPLYYHVIHSDCTAHSAVYTSLKSIAQGKQLVYEFLNKNQIYEFYEPYFLIATKKEFSNSAIDEFIQKKSFIQFFKTLAYLKSFPFCKNAFRKANYSLAKYRFGGKVFRKIVSILIRL